MFAVPQARVTGSSARSSTDLIVLSRVSDLPDNKHSSTRSKSVAHQQYVPQPALRDVECVFSGPNAPGFPGTYQFQYFCDTGVAITAGSRPDAVSEVFNVCGPELEVCIM